MRINNITAREKIRRRLDSLRSTRYKLKKKVSSDLYTAEEKKQYQEKLDMVLIAIEEALKKKYMIRDEKPEIIFGLETNKDLPVGLMNRVGFID